MPLQPAGKEVKKILLYHQGNLLTRIEIFDKDGFILLQAGCIQQQGRFGGAKQN